MSCGSQPIWSLCIKSVLDNDSLFKKLDSNLADGRPLRSFYVSQILLTPSTWTIIRSDGLKGSKCLTLVHRWGFFLTKKAFFEPYVKKFLLDARKVRDCDREKIPWLGSKTSCRRSQGVKHRNSWLCRSEFHPSRTFSSLSSYQNSAKFAETL